MKEGFWKKVLVGVVASLITLSAASLASSIVQRVRPDEEEESTANTCTHTKIIEVSGVAPTCIESGLTDGIFCGVCHGVIKPQQVIDPLGHIPVVVPGYAATCVSTGLMDGQTCGVCEAVIVKQETIAKVLKHNYQEGHCVDCGVYDTSSCIEVKAEEGELVAGNWYRMYRDSSMGLSCDLINPLYENFLGFYANSGNGTEKSGFVQCAGTFTGCQVLGMEFVIEEDYIDIYLAPSLYSMSNVPSIQFEITEETTITSISGTVYRLELPGGESSEESSS